MRRLFRVHADVFCMNPPVEFMQLFIHAITDFEVNDSLTEGIDCSASARPGGPRLHRARRNQCAVAHPRSLSLSTPGQ